MGSASTDTKASYQSDSNREILCQGAPDDPRQGASARLWVRPKKHFGPLSVLSRGQREQSGDHFEAFADGFSRNLSPTG
jgi:hypothetical protein